MQLRLQSSGRQARSLYDVGAGTGSVSVELSLMAGQADVYAIECEEKQ